MDKPIAAAEANRQFSRILRDVQGGDSFVVTARGRPVARIIPVTDTDTDREAARAELLRRATSNRHRTFRAGRATNYTTKANREACARHEHSCLR